MLIAVIMALGTRRISKQIPFQIRVHVCDMSINNL